MNNETSFKQHNKERFIIVAGVKEWEWERIPFVSLVSMLVLGLQEACVKLAAACSSAMGSKWNQ